MPCRVEVEAHLLVRGLMGMLANRVLVMWERAVLEGWAMGAAPFKPPLGAALSPAAKIISPLVPYFPDRTELKALAVMVER